MKMTTAPNARAPADRLRGPGQRRGGDEIAEQADRQHHGGERGEAIRRKPSRDHHHAADQHDAKTRAHQDAAGEQDRPGRRQSEDGGACRGEDEHAGDREPRAKMVEQEAARDLHGGEAEEERPRQRSQRFGTDREVAHQVEADGDVGSAEKMAGDIGGSQCRDDDQAPAVGEGAPHGGLYRQGYVPLLVENCPAGSLNRDPMRAWCAVQACN